MDIKGQLIEGIFLKRHNRFIAEVMIGNNIHFVHVPNTGRMRELLIKGARVVVKEVSSQSRKTNFELLMVYKGDELTCIDSRLPNELIYNEIKSNNIIEFKDYKLLRREVQFNNSRFDLFLSQSHCNTFIEVKSVNLFENKIARFPDAPTIRGAKHLRELIEAQKEGFRSVVLFVVLTEDVEYFRPNDEMDPLFGRLLRNAYIQGISIQAYSCYVSTYKIELKRRLLVLI